MWQSLTDFNGDGRPDFVVASAFQLAVAPGQPTTDGGSSFGAVTSSSGVSVSGPVEKRWGSAARFTDFVVDEEWRQAMDVNGDGRIDIVDASEQSGHWVIYLNTPGATPSDITWVRKTWRIDDLYNQMSARGLAVKPDHIPLSSRSTGHDTRWNACVVWDGSKWVDAPYACGGPPSQIEWPIIEKTFTEWEVRDINGDGFADVVFNSSPVVVTPVDETGSCDRTKPCNVIRTKTLAPRDSYPQLHNHLDAMLNRMGMFMDDPSSVPPFSAPITLATSGCGVSLWQQLPEADPDHTGTHPSGNAQGQVCGLIDVNGDALPDLVAGGVAHLGTGSGFTDVAISIPVATAQHSDHFEACKTGTTSTAYFIGGLRDVNGDGIPDAVANAGSNAWTVSFGTGAGFAPAIPIASGTMFNFSSQVEACNGTSSATNSGFYDIDGDGKADMVQLAGGKLEVYQLSGGSSAHVTEAGRLTSVDNGYGALTSIGYRSAKEDPFTRHAVPFAEIVVSRIEQTGTLALGGKLATTLFAYGGAQLFYDPMHERWSFPGYTRWIEERVLASSDKESSEATITDRYGLPVFDPSMTPARRFGRYQRAGKVSDVTVIAGPIGLDPWLMFNINVAGDTRRVGTTHYDYDTMLFAETSGSAAWEILDVMYPYDFVNSFGYNLGTGKSFDATRAHGFTWRTTRETWRGSAGPSSNVVFRDTVAGVDRFGNPLRVVHEGDLYRNDDDYCVDTTYAEGTTPASPVGAPARRTVSSCDPKGSESFSLAVQRWEVRSARERPGRRRPRDLAHRRAPRQ